MSQITSVDELVTLMGEPLPPARDKTRHSLHELDRLWLAGSPLVMIATSDAEGNHDVSPKGDPAGFTKVIDDTTIAIPERPGNRRADSFHNILQNPHVGLLFLIPGRGDTLRINGRATLLTDAAYFDDMIVRNHRPVFALEVAIDEVFYHCSKAFLRSKTWEPTRGLPSRLPAARSSRRASSARMSSSLCSRSTTDPRTPTRSMGRVLGALAVLLALTGCSVAALPEPGLSDAERQLFQQQMRDSYWVVTGLPDEQRPPAGPMTVVSRQEWPARFVECMNAEGFANYAAAGEGYSSYTIEAEDPTVEALASYVCSTSFWTDYGWLNTAQVDYLYDYYEQSLVPCLAVHDAPVWGAPSREKFFADGGGWHPYFNFPKVDQERIFADESLPVDCPPMPPGTDDPGYSGLWN